MKFKDVKPYEIIYYFVRNNIGNTKNLKFIYKYLYYLTNKDKRINPSWESFIEKMKVLYKDII